jgi:hypothetical protein
VKEVRFVPEVGDLIAAKRLHQRIAMQRAPVSICIGLGIILVGMFAIDGRVDWSAFAVACAAVASFVILVILAARYITIPKAARKLLRLDKSLQSEISIRWDDAYIELQHPNGHWKSALGDFACAVENPVVLLLFRQTNMYHFMPTRAFLSLAQRDELVALFRANGVSSHWPPK